MDRTREALKTRLTAVGIALVTGFLYLRCLGNGFVSDDGPLIRTNHYLSQWSFMWKSLLRDEYWFNGPSHLSSRYRPLLLEWFALDYHLFGLSPAGWHATMIGLHLVAVYLAYKVAERLTHDRFVGLLAALLFALLPVHAEAVVWPAGFGLVICAVFELGAFYLLMEGGRRNWAWALALYPLALLGHESAATFPALVGTYALLLPSQDEASGGERNFWPMLRRAMLWAAPFAAEVLLFVALRWWVLGVLTDDPNSLASHAGLGRVMLTIPRVLLVYFGLLVVPWLAGPAHRVRFVTSIWSAGFWTPVAVLALLATALWLLMRSHRLGRLSLFCVAWIVIGLGAVMALQAFMPNQLVHDNYLYLSSLGWCLLVASWVAELAQRSAAGRRVALGAAAALALLYAGALWNVQRFWHDDLTLVARCVAIFPDSVNYRNNLALALLAHRDVASAQREFKKSLSIDPNNGVALYYTGLLQAQAGHLKEAEQTVARGLVHMPPKASVNGYLYLARLYDQSGDHARSEAAIEHAESLPGGLPDAALADADLKINHGDAAGGEKVARELASRFPNDPRVWAMLGTALAAQNKNEPALAAYRQALDLMPNDTAINFFAAVILHKLGRDAQALSHCRRVLAIAPNDPSTRALIAQIERASSQ